MPRFMMKLLCLLIIGYVVYKNRNRILNQVLAFQAIRHLVGTRMFSLSAFREHLLNRFLFSR